MREDGSKQKVLLMDWPAFGIESIKRVLPQMGYDVELFAFPYDSGTRYEEALGIRIAERILESGADLIFSFNFFPVIAAAAHACRKKYISWIYDSPAVMLYSMSVFFPENYIFHFDSEEVERMRRDGVENVFYMPLAADVEHYDRMIPEEMQKRKYDADVAMIGSMYREDKFRIFRKYEIKEPYVKGYLDALVAVQEQLYGVDVLEPGLTPGIMKRILQTVPLKESSSDSYETPAWTYANYYLAKQVTTEEREHLLRALSEKMQVALYTPQKTPYLSDVENRGSVDYYREAPYAIKCARINLNITLRSIHRGIPQRVMDILGCGGFLLTNYQADLCDAFEMGKDFVCYESIPHAVELAGYYLEHAKERQQIAANGYRKVKEQHNFVLKLGQIMKLTE
ncbi:MAG: glycosyltransferase [Lachnospiraceae bacterium]|nr:glycosyltransferase [Lachnospiraceae bacterium]